MTDAFQSVMCFLRDWLWVGAWVGDCIVEVFGGCRSKLVCLVPIMNKHFGTKSRGVLNLSNRTLKCFYEKVSYLIYDMLRKHVYRSQNKKQVEGAIFILRIPQRAN